MTINEMCVNNVSDGSNCKRDNGNSSQLTDKTINRRNRIDNCGKTFEEILENAQAAMRVDVPTPEFDAIGDVLEDVLALKGLSVEARLSNIENMSSNTELKKLETILGVSSGYYRNKYFALLKVIALGVDIK